MDTKELICRCKSIIPKEEEEDAVVFIGRMKMEEERITAHCLVGKKPLNRYVSIEYFRV